MKVNLNIFRLATIVIAIGLLATGCPTDARDEEYPELRGNVTISYNTNTLAVDSILTADTINLTNGGAIYFQWQRGVYPNFTNIGDPIIDGNTYTVTNEDINHQIRVVITRIGTIGQIESGHVGPVLVSSVPSLQGDVGITFTDTLGVDAILTATTTNLTSGGAIYFQWQRGAYPNFTNIGDPIIDGNTYIITNEDINYQIRVVVTRTGTAGQIESLPVGPVPDPNPPRLVADQLADLRTGEPPSAVTITTGIASEQIEPQMLAFGGRQVTITLTRGNPDDTLYLASPGAMFTIGNGVTLILEDIELRGIPNNTSALVVAQNGGTLVMDADAKIANNVNINTDAVIVNQGGGIRIASGGAFVMQSGVIADNSAMRGGGVISQGAFSMYEGGMIIDNDATFGSGVFILDDTFDMHGGTISGNIASDQGGGVIVFGGAFNMRMGNIFDNEASYGGGVINFSVFYMRDGNIFDNAATSDGGGVANGMDGTFTMLGGVIRTNDAGRYGGGVSNVGTFIMHEGSINNNTSINGGGVENDWVFTIHYGEVHDNTATLSGGGVFNTHAFTILNNGRIFNNEATGVGGGVYNRGTFSMYFGEIFGNEVLGSGGGVASENVFIMRDGMIHENTATLDGGGVFNRGAFSMAEGTISDNVATRNGGGVINLGVFTMENGGISNNDSVQDGGGVFNFGDRAIFDVCDGLISGNTARHGGGVANWAAGTVFNMRGGIISGNSVIGLGGGVINASGTFLVSDGTIYGVDASTGEANAASTNGAALANATIGGIPAISEYGTFGDAAFDSNGVLPGFIDLTIEVAGGDLIRPTMPLNLYGDSRHSTVVPSDELLLTVEEWTQPERPVRPPRRAFERSW